jgi:ribonucleoside-diphosphate reductase alpha chain
MDITVTKLDGQREPFNADLINQAISRAAHGLSDQAAMTSQVASEIQLTLYDGITTRELDQAAINTAAQNIKEDPDYDIIAKRLLLKTIYKEVLGDYNDDLELVELQRSRFADYINQGISDQILDQRLDRFKLSDLALALDIGRDELFNYTGVSTLMSRYLTKNSKQKLLETPQFFWMRVAMGLALNETDATKIAIEFYHKMSNLYYIPGGSTNINAGTITPRLSNCYLMDMEDSIEHIGKTVSDVMKLSKATGGIGLSVTKLRANGSPINTNSTFSSGPVPFLHIIDSTIRAISRAGKKMGALCFYMENWHLNFDEFLDLKQNAGDEYRRTRTANTAVYISDEFMKRVEADDWWYLFDPKETPDLVELYGSAFSQRYQDYIKQAENHELRSFHKVKAREQWRNIIVNLQATSHPWITWKDAINNRALNHNTGTIYCSNLCTEITLPQNRNNVSFCNLASINLARHLQDKAIAWDLLQDSVRLAIRQLDNLVDINEPPIPEAINFDRANRAVGLGIMGLSDAFEQMGLAYESEEAFQLVDKIMEFISYHAISASTELAQEKGSYDNFAGSLWSEGLVPVDTIDRLAQARGQAIDINQSHQLDWDALRAKVKQGIRNSTLMAIAPTANIGLVAGTSPGIDPRFAQIFSRNTLTGKYLELNNNLVNDLKALDLWEKVRDQILADYGSLENIDVIPEHLKKIYKDSFATDPRAFIEVAARAQKWVDQAISRNMYLETRDADEIMAIYQDAWKRGLKTTYYLHMRPRHKAEQSTVKVNKSNSIGKLGFGAVQTAWVAPEVVATTPVTTWNTPQPVPVSNDKSTCPIDPMERLQCESCQ